MRKGRKKRPEQRGPRVNINEQIRAKDLRVIDETKDESENLGVLSRSDALAKAKELETDLIEVTPNAQPPVAKLMEYGKFQYDQNKKHKEQKARKQTVEIKSVQVKPATGEHDLEIKAKRASTWLAEGNRVKVELFLKGRSKYMSHEFLRSRLDRFFNLITEEYKIAQEPKKSPKGLTAIIEKAS